MLGLIALTFAAVTALNISALAAQIRGWQETDHVMVVYNTYPFYTTKYHTHEGALDGEAWDRYAEPDEDYSFQYWGQPAYYRVKCRGYNDWQQGTMRIYYKVHFCD